MNFLLQKQTIYTALMCFGLLFLALVPVSVFAEVVPLAPLPTNFGDNTDTLGGYINTIFYTIIATAAVLAMLRIVWGGFQYMTSEAVTQTKDARTIITMAVAGLILLLGSWLILYVINPSLTELDVLKFEDLEEVTVPSNSSGGSTTEGGGQNQGSGSGEETLVDSEKSFSSSNSTANKEAAQARAAQCRSDGYNATVTCDRSFAFDNEQCSYYTVYCDSTSVDRGEEFTERFDGRSFAHAAGGLEEKIDEYTAACEAQGGVTERTEWCGITKQTLDVCPLLARTEVYCTKPI